MSDRKGVPVRASRRVAGSNASRTESPHESASPAWCTSSRITSVLNRSTRIRWASAFVATPAEEASPGLSPDGNWLAYSSNVSGRREIYVRPFPMPGRATPVSANGGVNPVWGRDGGTIYYWQLDQLFAAETSKVAGFAASAYHRGIRFVSVPTTLLGQVDAAIGIPLTPEQWGSGHRSCSWCNSRQLIHRGDQRLLG